MSHFSVLKTALLRSAQMLLLVTAVSFTSGKAFGCVSAWADTSSDGTYVYGTATLEDDSSGNTLEAMVELWDPTYSYYGWDDESAVESVTATGVLAIASDYGTYSVCGSFYDPGFDVAPAAAGITIGTSVTSYATTGNNGTYCTWTVSCPTGTSPTCTTLRGVLIVWNQIIGCNNYLGVPYVYYIKSGITYCFVVGGGTMGVSQQCT
jgi:hypothetical protein